MIRRAARRIAAVLVFLLLAALGVGIYLLHRVDRHWVAAQLEQALERKVTIGGMKVNLFSNLGSFIVRDIAVSRRLPPRRRERMQSIPADMRLMSAGESRLRIRWLPLLQRRLEIDSLVLQDPQLYIERYAAGGTNLDDLLNREPGDAPALRTVRLGGLFIRGGRVHWRDRVGGVLYVLEDLVFNSTRRKDVDAWAVTAAFRLRSLRLGKGAIGRMVDVDWRIRGGVHPGRAAGALLDFSFQVDLPRGRIGGMTLLQRLRRLPAVTDLLGILGQIKDEITWKDGALRLAGNGPQLRLEDGLIRTRGYHLEYSGSWNMADDSVDLGLVFRFPKGDVTALRRHLLGRIQPLVPAFLRKAAPPGELADQVLAALLDAEGRPRLALRVKGTLAEPRLHLVKPGMASLRRAVTEMLRQRALGQGGDVLRRLLQ